MAYVYSTLTQKMGFARRVKTAGDIYIIDRLIEIKGGAQAATQWGNSIITPLGSVTEVSEEDLEILRNDPTFVKLEKAGVMTVDNQLMDVEKKVSGGMWLPDTGAVPVTDQDIAQTDRPDDVEIRVTDNKSKRVVAQAKNA